LPWRREGSRLAFAVPVISPFIKENRHATSSLVRSDDPGRCGHGSAFAQAYPNKVIKLQVPFAPGGTTDIIARVIAEPLGKALGQSVIVENKAAAGASWAPTKPPSAAPDGYSLGMATVSTTAANPAINPKMPYNPRPTSRPSSTSRPRPNVIAVHPASRPRTTSPSWPN
jgi:tripartite-type tricarboxylate transporter receptor subunit TctC